MWPQKLTLQTQHPLPPIIFGSTETKKTFGAKGSLSVPNVYRGSSRKWPQLSQRARCHPHLLGMHWCHIVTREIISLWTLNKYHQVQPVWQHFQDKEESDHPFKGPLSMHHLEKTVLGGGGPFRSVQEHKSGQCQNTSDVPSPGLQQHFLRDKSPFTIFAAKMLTLVASRGSQTFWIGLLSPSS